MFKLLKKASNLVYNPLSMGDKTTEHNINIEGVCSIFDEVIFISGNSAKSLKWLHPHY